MMVLVLNDRQITGYGLTVTCEMSLPADDLSGQSSSSVTAEKGFKPKRLRVSLNIKREDSGTLKALTKMVEAVDAGTGKRKVYTIVNDTADAMCIRQVRFSERLTAQELDDVDAWAVSFVLLEHLSAPEKVEAVQVKAPVDSEIPVNDAPAVAEATAEPSELSWFERSVLAPLDSALADETSNTDEIQS